VLWERRERERERNRRGGETGAGMRAAKIAASLPLSRRTGKTRRGNARRRDLGTLKKIPECSVQFKIEPRGSGGGCVCVCGVELRAGVGDRRAPTGVFSARRLAVAAT